MKRMSHILLYMCIAILAVAGLVSCDVHEFPDDGEQGGGETKEFVLLLDFTDALKWGFHTEIDYTQNRVPSMLPLRPADIDVRYIVKAYRVDANGSVASEPSAVVMEVGTDTTNLNHTVTLQLAPGAYKFLVWTDYVEHGKLTNLYYDPSNFMEVTYCDRKH